MDANEEWLHFSRHEIDIKETHYIKAAHNRIKTGWTLCILGVFNIGVVMGGERPRWLTVCFAVLAGVIIALGCHEIGFGRHLRQGAQAGAAEMRERLDQIEHDGDES